VRHQKHSAVDSLWKIVEKRQDVFARDGIEIASARRPAEAEEASWGWRVREAVLKTQSRSKCRLG
jgi:hypothetical protein